MKKSHKVKDGNLKMEIDGRDTKEGNFLYQQNCVNCKAVFVHSGANKIGERYKVSITSPCYECTSMDCSYFICKKCHDKEVLNEKDNGIKRCRKALKL